MTKNEYEWLDKQIKAARESALAAGIPTPIRMYLKRHHLTQSQVGKANGLPQSSIQKAANAVYDNITSRTYLMLANATGDAPAQVYAEVLDINNQILAKRDIRALQDHLTHILIDHGKDIDQWGDFSDWLRDHFPDTYFKAEKKGHYKGDAGTVIDLEMVDSHTVTGRIKNVKTAADYTMKWHERSAQAMQDPDNCG